MTLTAAPDIQAAFRELQASAAGATPAALIAAAVEKLGRTRVSVVSSFGAESAVLLDAVAQVDTAIPVLFLETGRHFRQTLDYRDALVTRLGLRDVRDLKPDADALAAFDADGQLWRTNPDHCCSLRKVIPLRRALEPFSCWINGRKRYQAETRRNIEKVELVDTHIKLNPLADLSAEEIEAWLTRRCLPRHSLSADGFFSIGCEPCTMRVAPGEQPRDGRWRGSGKSECGIHLLAQPAAAKPL